MTSAKAFVCKCKVKGALKEFMSSRIDFTRDAIGLGTFKFTQPVLVQKLEDEYRIDTSEKPHRTPAITGLVLVKGDDIGQLNGNGTM